MPDPEQGMYLHCNDCLQSKPENVSPRKWARINIFASSPDLLTIWCERCDEEIVTFEVPGIEAIAECDCEICSQERQENIH
jgi:hypothetical protein